MKSKFATTLVICALIVPAASYAQYEEKKPMKESIKENVGDAAITTKIKAEFAKDKEVSAMRISVDTDHKGMVTLKGNVKSQAEADKAVQIAKGTKGVNSVKSELTVQSK